MKTAVKTGLHRARALLDALGHGNEIARRHRVYANRNLRLDRAELIGFDMDYTLALYDQPNMEAISIVATVDKLISLKGYPYAIRDLPFDNQMGIRGLLVDKKNGNVLKPDRYGAPGRAYHGSRPIESTALRELYHRERTRISSGQFAFIDTLFALPEAVLFVALVDFFDAQGDALPGKPPYETLWSDIRECIDVAHQDGSIKNVIAGNLGKYIEKDPDLAETLHKMRSSGKRLFLLTNSAWDYTDPVMRFLLDGELDAYPSWRNFFDIIVVSSGKPGFFTEQRPFIVLDAHGKPEGPLREEAFSRTRVYSGGNAAQFESLAGARGDRVLFVGDHIYGDMLRSRKSSSWRTVMVIQELEHEVAVHDQVAESLDRLESMERQMRHLDGNIEEKQHILRSLQKLSGDKGSEEDADPAIGEAKQAAREMVDRLRTELRNLVKEHTALEHKLDRSFNPFWGPLFREGHEVSKFGDQVEDYACVYTSRVSNFRFYSPMRHFRGPRDRMPHER